MRAEDRRSDFPHRLCGNSPMRAGRRQGKLMHMTDSLDASLPSGLDAIPPPGMARGRRRSARRRRRWRQPRCSCSRCSQAHSSPGCGVLDHRDRGWRRLPYGVSRLLAGVAFSLGLVLVVVAGAELFTGNNLIVMAWASRRVTTARLLRNWAIVYAGNFAGAVATAALVFGAASTSSGRARSEARRSRRRRQVGSRLRPGDRARRPLQRARVPRRVALLQRPHDDRQGAGGRAAGRRVRGGRLRAQRREHVLPADRAVREGLRLRRRAHGHAGPLAPDLGALPPTTCCR